MEASARTALLNGAVALVLVAGHEHLSNIALQAACGRRRRQAKARIPDSMARARTHAPQTGGAARRGHGGVVDSRERARAFA